MTGCCIIGCYCIIGCCWGCGWLLFPNMEFTAVEATAAPAPIAMPPIIILPIPGPEDDGAERPYEGPEEGP